MTAADPTPSRRWLLAVLLLVVLTGSYCIGIPFSASTREAQTAMITRNLWHDGWSGLWLPRIDWLGNEPGYMLLEFPLYNAVVAVTYALWGPHDGLGQIVSLACTLGAVLFLYGLVRRTEGERTALAAAALTALTPLYQFIGQSCLPEPMLMLCLLAALYAMLRHAESGGMGWLTLATLAASAALLLKSPTGLFLMPPLAFLAWTRYGWQMPRQPALWTAAIVALGLYAVWQEHANRVNAQFYPYFVSTSPSQVFWNFGPLAMRWDWHFYVRVAGRLFVYLSPILVLAAIPALGRRPTTPRAWLWHVWLASNAGYVLLCANLHFRHKHYQIVFVPILAVLAARMLVAWWPQRRRMVVAATVLLLAYDLRLGWQLWLEQRDPVVERACAALRAVSAPQDLVVVASFDGSGGRTANQHNNPVWLYAAERKGWNVPLYEQFDAAAVEQYRQQGARWLLLNRLTIPDDKADNLPYQTIGWNRTGALLGAADKSSEHPDERLTRLLKELAARYPCIQPAGESFVILDLRGS